MTRMTPAPPGPPEPRPPLRRASRRKVLAGVCGGLGRHFDLDPVIFRITIGVLAATGGIGLIFYGFAWLVIPAEDEEENEARRLLSGRVEGTTLTAVLLALVGCGLFLSAVGNGGMISFSVLLALAVAGAAVWSQRRRQAVEREAPLDPATAHAVAEAPPETKAPPPPEAPSWWRDPRAGAAGPAEHGYLWGPPDAPGPSGSVRSAPPAAVRGPRSIGGTVFLLAVLAGALATRAAWDSQPLGICLQIGLACALAVFALGLTVSSFLGRTGFGTILMTVVTALLLAGTTLVPQDIDSGWTHARWSPATAADIRPRYSLGTGDGTLDLSDVAVPAGRSVRASAEVGAGRLRIVTPRDVTVKVRAQVGLGDLRLPDEPVDDIGIAPDLDVVRTFPPPPDAAPAGTLDLTLDVGVGQVEVTRAAS